MGISLHCGPDYVVRLRNGVTLVLEIKGMETEQDRVKHQAGRRWMEAVNNWGKLGKWDFHMCKDPQMLGRELGYLVKAIGE
jgi:type III restriction enzyme